MKSGVKNLLPKVKIKDPIDIRFRRKLSSIFSGSFSKEAATGWPSMPYTTVELVYWRPSSTVNFGDELSRSIVELMLAKRGLTVFDEIAERRRMLAIGSIIHYAEDNSVIWGSGINGSVVESAHKYRQLDVRAVRGPITRKFLIERGIDVPEVYGDPGLLVRFLTGPRFPASKRTKIGLVPHMSDLESKDVKRYSESSEVSLINPYRSWNKVTEEIAACEFVISSSLHGLVVADAYNIPSIYVRLGQREGLLKYEDYYAGSGRSLAFATSISEAMSKGPCAVCDFDAQPLLNAFPYDLWSS